MALNSKKTNIEGSSNTTVSDAKYCERLKLICKEKLSSMREFIYLILGFKLDTHANGEFRLISRYSFSPLEYFSFSKDEGDGIPCGNGWICTRVPVEYESLFRECFQHSSESNNNNNGKAWSALFSQITVTLLGQETQL